MLPRMAVCFVALSFLSAARAEPLTLQPDRLDFGTVRVGSAAEGSVLVFAPGSDLAGVSVKVEPPPFVRIDNIRLNVHTYGGQAPTKISCEFDVLLETGKAGELKGEIAVEFAKEKIAVPVAASVAPAVKGQTRVLVVETPFQKYATGDAKVFQPWLDLVKAAEIDPHYWLVNPGKPVLRGNILDQFDVVLLAEMGLFGMQDEDRKRLKRFVELGGRLIVCANHFMVGSVAKANELAMPFGLKMIDEEPGGVGQIIRLKKESLADDPLLKDVVQLDFHRPSPVTVTNTKKGKLLAVYQEGKGLMAVSRDDPGELVVLGESMWWHWIHSHPQSDDGQLLRNLLTKPPKK